MKIFLGFTGVKQSGKNTACTFLKEKYPFVTELALADKLKNECARVFDIPRVNFDASELKEKELPQPVYLDEDNVPSLIKAFGLPFTFDQHVRPHMATILHTPRQIAQYVGTEVLRSISADVHCLGTIRDLPEDGVFVVTDMRFPNEYEFFSNNYRENFFPFYIDNKGAEAKSARDAHASERYILEIAKKCERIDNNGSLQGLQAQILKAFEGIMAKYEGR